MLSEQKRLDNQINSIKEQLDFLPPGKLICVQNGKYSKWFQSDGHTKTYIPKSNRQLAEKLAVKKYLSIQLKELEKERQAIECYLKRSRSINDAEKLLTETSEFQKLLKPHIQLLSEELSNWQNLNYEHNNQYPEQLIHNSCSGNMVRSKSEFMIDMYLYTHNIPFRYECALNLGETIIYPDFTIRHPETGETFYWEHFGLMDHQHYVKNAYYKLQTYANYGIIPSINLITTYETRDNPLTYEKIERIVEEYFN